MIWARLGATPPLLYQLRQQVDDQLLRTGRPLDSSPAAVDHQCLKRQRDFAGPSWHVEAFHLMASEPTRRKVLTIGA